ncbi:MAG: OB-fold domain-containing protein [Proteobacteria bacterium]|nr:OB-fold domain-containing protein [Pseudomonadota bacterium]
MAEQVPIREGAFVQGPEGAELVGNRCQGCGQIFFPKVQTCLTCFGDNLEETRLNRKGELYSYAIGHMPSMHFQPPYAIGYINLPEGIRVFAPLKIRDDKPFEAGMEMEVVIDHLWTEGDRDILGYMFRPV